ncbi:Phosphoglycerol transferase MdoB [Muriicola jejuensis]|uniref:Sulfatase-like hydrolase/transferase n=1 Tax=Muriicola jejuensis TaxID=504488 RepID=A0A6P0UF67_9FLAO|nr:sulfatase-like hydrolase/transferase [Muriicola jejuensis]NER11262.1 sulfatase-like hydrolase/transferase [Muriicola jejuensis]SMP21828.1 Phosphoglycerol transferase MdoB [Muriicola jejuensis]
MRTKIDIRAKKRDLRDFIRLILAFYLCQLVIAIYQNIRLYSAGVFDGILNKSFLLLAVHHLGFASLTALALVFPFKFLEQLKSDAGFKMVTMILVFLLGAEGLLTRYYIANYEILGAGFTDRIEATTGWTFLYYIPVFVFFAISLLYLFYRITANFYSAVSRMYPFTIIIFSLFLATLITRKNPVNENKTEHLIYHQMKESLDFNKYEGQEEYPLLRPLESSSALASHFQLKQERPNIVFIIMDGVGSDFIGEKAPFKAFMPYLNSLLNESLYWPHGLSNTGEPAASIPSIFGSLPFGEEGFTNLESLPESYTLFDLLNEDGYQTSFNFGGNISLENLGRFLHHEGVDLISGRKTFGPQYLLQEEDAAGISLGYPDAELFRKWFDDYTSVDRPRLDVFLTQSTKSPFLIPSLDKYEKKVEEISTQAEIADRNKRLIRKNEEIFASLLYTDQAVRTFMEGYKRKAEFYNTIFIITGTHNLSELPQKDYLGRYRVPLIISSPMLISPSRINSLVAHTDVLPELAGLLHSQYQVSVPEMVSWLGTGLFHEGFFEKDKIIPLFRHRGNIQEYIRGNVCISGNSVYRIGADLNLFEPGEAGGVDELRTSFRNFKAINQYVTRNNKLLPGNTLAKDEVNTLKEKSEMVWINSVFNSDDYDNAYRTARDLAISGDRERALLLCEHILKEVPGHADTEILKGRIFAWNKEYEQAAQLLEKTIKKYPVYADAYSALLDVYFWSDTNYKALDLKALIKKHRLDSEELRSKIKRAEDKMKKDQTLFRDDNLGYLNFEEDGYE